MVSRDELLRLLGDAPDNEMNLDLLTEQIERGTGVVPFVGAGTSVPFGFPPWSSFLLSLAERAGIPDRIQARLDASEYEEAAEDVVQALGARRFQDLVEHSFGDRQLRDRQLTGAISWIPRISVGPVITTNFDHVLERAFAAAECHFDHVVIGARADLAIKGFHANKLVLLKIHGDVDDTEGRILTLAEYEEHYGATNPDRVDGDRPLPKLLQLMMSARPLLFVGCSLGPDRTVSVLAAVTRALPAVAHYAIVERPAGDDAFRAKDRHLSDRGIRPIWYPPARHDLIEQILVHLADLVPEHLRRGPPEEETEEAAPPHNLPSDISTFVGREADIVTVRDHIAKHRLVTLVGAGGCGKTRLAIQTARTQLSEFEDGVWIVELAAVKDPRHVPLRVAGALQMQEQAREPPTEVLAAYLAPRTVLLVLDNCEHLVEACAALVSELLTRCPRLKVLATSRQVLNVAGEEVVRVRPLEVSEAIGALDEFVRSDAVQLFVERARAHQPDFTVTKENAAAVRDICRRLDGIPLAIELAAARLAVLNAQEISERLDNAFALLTGGKRAAREQHQTLEATMSWSYDLLTADQQRLLRGLSVFAGGWDVAAAAAVAAAPGEDDIAVLDGLTELIDRSLVVSDADDGRRRFHLLETIRQYGGAKLEAAGETRAVSSRHRDWFLSVTERASPELLTKEQSKWLRALETDHDNVLGAIRCCVQQEDVDAALRFGAAIWRFWEIRGYLIMGRDQLATLIDLPADEESEAARAKVLSGAGMLAYRQGDAAAARDLFERAIELERKRDNAPGIANALNDLGIVAQTQGDFVGAQQSYTESHELERQLGNERGVAVALYNMGNTTFFLGDLDEAERLLDESFAKFEATNNLRESAFPLTVLGMVHLFRGDSTRAREFFQRSYDRRAELGDRRGMGDSLNGLGRASLLEGKLKEAHNLLVDSLTVRREVGDKKGIAGSLESFALFAETDGEMERAAVMLTAAAALRETIGVPRPPIEQVLLERCDKSLRDALSEAAYNKARERGRSMSLDSVVAEVLSPSSRTSRKSGEIRSSKDVMRRRVSQAVKIWKSSS